MTDDRRVVLQGQLLPSVRTEESPRLPAGVPFGLAYFGERKYDGMARVLEAYERAIRAASGVVDAKAELTHAYERLELARKGLGNVDLYAALDRSRIQHAYNDELRRERDAVRAEEEAADLAQIRKMRRELEKLQIEERASALQEPRQALRSLEPGTSVPTGKFADVNLTISTIPTLVRNAGLAKAEIIKAAGGEDRLSDGDRNALELIDALVQAAVAKQAEGGLF